MNKERGTRGQGTRTEEYGSRNKHRPSPNSESFPKACHFSAGGDNEGTTHMRAYLTAHILQRLCAATSPTGRRIREVPLKTGPPDDTIRTQNHSQIWPAIAPKHKATRVTPNIAHSARRNHKKTAKPKTIPKIAMLDVLVRGLAPADCKAISEGRARSRSHGGRRPLREVWRGRGAPRERAHRCSSLRRCSEGCAISKPRRRLPPPPRDLSRGSRCWLLLRGFG